MKYAPLLHENFSRKVLQFFSYVKYSQAQIQWSSEYGLILLVGILISIGLWIGYRNNEIEDERKKLEKIAVAKARKERLRKIKSLYPKK